MLLLVEGPGPAMGALDVDIYHDNSFAAQNGGEGCSGVKRRVSEPGQARE